MRTLTECAVIPIGDEIHLTVTGDGFLYHMVRIMAGTLLEIGQGKYPRGRSRPSCAVRTGKEPAKPPPPAGFIWSRYSMSKRRRNCERTDGI